MFPPPMLMGLMPPAAPVKEGGDDSEPPLKTSAVADEEAAALAAHLSALCNAFRPSARPATQDDSELLAKSLLLAGSSSGPGDVKSASAIARHSCHVALQASAFSAFKPAGRPLASA